MWIDGWCGTDTESLSFLLAVDDAFAAMIYILVVPRPCTCNLPDRRVADTPRLRDPYANEAVIIPYLLTIHGELKVRSESQRVSLSWRLHSTLDVQAAGSGGLFRAFLQR